MTQREVFNEFIKGKAVHEYHYAKPDEIDSLNQYEPGSEEYLVYQEKIEELKLFYKSQEGVQH